MSCLCKIANPAPSWQVAPAEIEAVLMQHPLIADAAVAGVTLEDGVTEVPRAYIVRKSGELSGEEVYTFAKGQLATYKALEGGIFFVDSIPRTPLGKIQRYKLPDLSYTGGLPEKVKTVLIQSAKEITDHGV